MTRAITFSVKICGITNETDARAAISAGADCIGLNLYSPSRRSVTLGQAASIASAVDKNAKKVGLFVNHTLNEIREAVAQSVFDIVQLHGDEPPELLAELRDVCVMKAFRLSPRTLAGVDAFLSQSESLGRLPDFVLIDADQGGKFGGTGQVVDWQLVASERKIFRGLPLILAGGLNPANVEAAIDAVRPDAVDVSSGVESGPGKKDPTKLQRFVTEARRALAKMAKG